MQIPAIVTRNVKTPTTPSVGRLGNQLGDFSRRFQFKSINYLNYRFECKFP